MNTVHRRRKSPAVPPEPIWTMRDGTKIPVKDMGDQHLINAVRMCERVARKRHAEELKLAYSMSCMIQGEMASMDIDNAIDRLEETDPLDMLPEVYDDMLAEIKRRGLTL